MKEKYLKELAEVLKIAFSEADAEQITNDYSELFEDYLNNGLSEEEIIKKLGEPKEIVKSLIEEQRRMFPSISKFKVVLPKRRGKKLVQAMPILALLIYLFLGYVFDAWHPGWLIFFLIPISSVLFTPYKRRKFSNISPFLAVAIFILIGTYVESGYLFAWIAFLLIPIINILDSND